MKKEKKIVTGTIEEKHFKVDPTFKDPLDPINVFDEIEIEEYKAYYNVFLGIPVNQEES